MSRKVGMSAKKPTTDLKEVKKITAERDAALKELAEAKKANEELVKELAEAKKGK